MFIVCVCVCALGPTLLFSMFSAFPIVDSKVCVCVCVCVCVFAASDMVRSKNSKYPQHKSPAAPMVPFVVEALGRLSPEAHGLLAAIAPADKKVRSQVLRTAKQTLSVLVQTGLAELLLSAEPGRGVPAPAAAAA